MKKCKTCLNVIRSEKGLNIRYDFSTTWRPIRDGKILHWSWNWGTRCGLMLSLFGRSV